MAFWKVKCNLRYRAVVLLMDVCVDAQAFTCSTDNRWFCGEGEGNILSSGGVMGFVCKIATTKIFGFFDVCTFCFELICNGLNNFFNRGGIPLHVQDNKSFVLSHDV